MTYYWVLMLTTVNVLQLCSGISNDLPENSQENVENQIQQPAGETNKISDTNQVVSKESSDCGCETIYNYLPSSTYTSTYEDTYINSDDCLENDETLVFRVDKLTKSKYLTPLFEGSRDNITLREVKPFKISDHSQHFGKEYAARRYKFKWPGHQLIITYYGYVGQFDVVAGEELTQIFRTTSRCIIQRLVRHDSFYRKLLNLRPWRPKETAVAPEKLDRLPESEEKRFLMYEMRPVERLETCLENFTIIRNYIFIFPGNKLTVSYYGFPKKKGCDFAQKLCDVANYTYENIAHKIIEI